MKVEDNGQYRTERDKSASGRQTILLECDMNHTSGGRLCYRHALRLASSTERIKTEVGAKPANNVATSSFYLTDIFSVVVTG